ncbi:hypothetical protein OIDMADRAFT_17592 [Oidiodendron maius Zn]|uniref:Uncharacterized protein n=1 Tax=Oidiodendron maius (strain Zn) TaxID=913774 RepID=A0A0C3H8R4_OIDMZ|nr:hypothetical protein OIDMADRAFT_17592 [Oidiodendron maius Zn]
MEATDRNEISELPARDALQQVMNRVKNWAPDIRIAIGPRAPGATWAAVSEVLQPSDRKIMIFPPPIKRDRQSAGKCRIHRLP